MELKREMLDIQKDLSDKIETMKVILYNNYINKQELVDEAM